MSQEVSMLIGSGLHIEYQTNDGYWDKVFVSNCFKYRFDEFQDSQVPRHDIYIYREMAVF